MRVSIKNEKDSTRYSGSKNVIVAPDNDNDRHWQTEIAGCVRAPRIFVDLADDVMADARETICTATVKFPDGRTAVCHFDIHVDDNGKVSGRITAGHKSRDVVRSVNVPAWTRRHA